MQEIVISVLKRASLIYPDKVAMIDGDVELTYREFEERVNQLANGLRSLGVEKGDAVAALCMNHYHYLEIYFACHAMGAVINPLNVRLAAPEINYILNDSQTKVLFIDQPFLPMLEQIKAGAKTVKHYVYSDTVGQQPDNLTSYDGIMEGRPKVYPTPDIHENDAAGYFYTGGTTGEPKGVILTNRNLCANAFHLQSIIQYKAEEIYLHIGPMFHLADAASHYAITMMGGTHIFGRAFEPKLTMELIQKHKVTMTILVPTMLNFVLAHPDFDKYDLSSLRNFLYGASPMPVPLLRKAIEKMPCLPIQGYGMTEASPLVTVLTPEDHKLGAQNPEYGWLLGTAGTPVPGVEIKIVDEKGEEVSIGSPGEIIVRGPNVMKGYLNKKKATDEAIRNGWYHSGDVAIRNERGYITIVDRMKDMIVSGGENVYTTEVENVVMQFPGVLETTVIGVPDEKWGEAVKAFVVMKQGQAASEIEIVEFCRQRLANYKCPKSVDFIDALPKSGAGKILKRELRKAYWGEGRQVN